MGRIGRYFFVRGRWWQYLWDEILVFIADIVLEIATNYFLISDRWEVEPRIEEHTEITQQHSRRWKC